ncbi:MAG TPA: low affinity iron permease family protein [Xanthobacteraceae bacterium]|jgi:low affinity Fe/Cu permease|nr:low affinity iron permease family protein [Xanthobacteraceae bacterium]
MNVPSARKWLTDLGVLTAHPRAFLIVLCYAALWLLLARDTFDWHALATLATWLMTLVIQRAEHRDTQAIHGKLDELLRVNRDAETDLVDLDEKEAEDIQRLRAQARAQDP